MNNVVLQENQIFLDVEFYCLDMNELQKVSSDPLFSWKRKYMNSTLRWGAERFGELNTAIWVTELCLISGKSPNQPIHYIPGAYLKAIEGTRTERTLKHIWFNINERYTFRRNEIIPQYEIQDFLYEHINNETTVFFKGGWSERCIAILCGAKSYCNIENLGVEKFQKTDLENPDCKVHKYKFEHCPKSETMYYMKIIDKWLPIFHELEETSNEKTDFDETCIFNENEQMDEN